MKQFLKNKQLNEYDKLNAIQNKAALIELKAKRQERLVAIEKKEQRRKWKVDEN